MHMHMHAHVMISSCAPRARDGKKTPSTNQLTLAMLSVPGCVDGRPSCNDLKDKKKCWQTRDPAIKGPVGCSVWLINSRVREPRTARAQAARVDADASMQRGTAMRAARRPAEAAEEAEEAAAEEELLLGCI